MILCIIFLIGMFFYSWTILFKKTSNKIVQSNSNQLKIILNDTKKEIEKSFLLKYPDWKEGGFTISIEKELPGYAMGTIFWPKSNGKGHWFAVKEDNQWVITENGGESYFGICQNFIKYKFPQEMVPDCWDEERKIMVNTPSPEKFYNGLTVEDKENIKKAFLDFEKNNDNFKNRDIYIMFNQNIGEYLKGAVLFGGSDNNSAPQFFAVKDNGNWKVLYYGQENPACSDIGAYNFPFEMISDCWDGNTWVNR